MNTKQTTEPTTLQEAVLYFADPVRALEYMKPLVWPKGIVCPHCGVIGTEKHHFIASRNIWRCGDCKKQFSIRLGTIMEDSPLGLDTWLCAMWLIGNANNGISSYEIHRALGITQKSAWFVLHRIRLAMKTGSFKKMSGTVEADEMYVGGKVQNFSKSKKRKLRAEALAQNPTVNPYIGRVAKKAIVLGMLERGQKGGKPSQMRAQQIEKASRPHITDVIKAHVDPGSFLMSDALKSYDKLSEEGFIHMAINHAIAYAEGRIHTNGVEKFWSLLARALHGTYVAVEPFHLDAYLDEQCFRFNNRKMKDADRMVRVLAGIVGNRLTYKALIGATEVGEQRPTVD